MFQVKAWEVGFVPLDKRTYNTITSEYTVDRITIPYASRPDCSPGALSKWCVWHKEMNPIAESGHPIFSD
jgi:hypothetical protein